MNDKNTRRAKGEGAVIRTTDGWRGYVTIDGKRVYKRAKTKRELLQRLSETKAAPNKARVGKMPTLLQFARSQLEGHLKSHLRYSTWALYETFWRTKLGNHPLAQMRIDEIRRADVQDFIDHWIAGYRPHTVRRLGSFVRMLLERAVDMEMLVVNPAAKVRYPTLNETSKEVLDPMDAVDLPRLIANPRLAAMVTVAIHTGLRRGELCGLRWEDVDAESKTIDVRRQITLVQDGVIESPPKTRRSLRQVELTVAALQAIQEQPKRSVYVFSTSTGEPVRPDTLARDFRKATKGTRFEKVHLHDLRASFITILLELGVDVRTVQELAGHASSSITQEIYARSRRELKKRAAASLDEALGGSAPRK